MDKVLIVAAHPDDEILGCGGTIAKLADKGLEVYTLILGEGMTSRGRRRNKKAWKKDILRLKDDARQANAILGVRDIFTFDFPDNRFDTVALLDIVKTIEEVKGKVKPKIIYTHHWGDLNIDHRITYNSVLTATRPLSFEPVKEIYSFEVPSSTEWNYPHVFIPNLFVDVSETINRKIEALRSYKTEAREFPHPRSAESILNTARRWGSVSNVKYAEAFEAVRVIR